jgi:hypothetical protein
MRPTARWLAFPLLFLLVMEVLAALITQADLWMLFKSFGPRAITHHASLYTDDLVTFLNPVSQDLQLLNVILDSFAGASGLSCNLTKCQLAAVRCDEG